MRVFCLLLRGGVCVLLQIAGLLARDCSRAIAARLQALFALASRPYGVCSAPGLLRAAGWWAAPILALATGNNVIFLLFAQALFDDSFRSRWWHPLLWRSIVAIGLFCGLFLEPEHSAIAASIRSLLTLQPPTFAGLAGAQTLVVARRSAPGAPAAPPLHRDRRGRLGHGGSAVQSPGECARAVSGQHPSGGRAVGHCSCGRTVGAAQLG